jgi:sialic acid synthase SpsE
LFEQDDKNLNKILEATRELLDASKGADVEVIGLQLAKRQICIDALKSSGGVTGNRTAARQSLIDEIIKLDAQACGSIRERTHQLGLRLFKFKKKASGLLHYNNSLYNLASGQLIDRSK